MTTLNMLEIIQNRLEIIFEGLFYWGEDFDVGVFEEILGYGY